MCVLPIVDKIEFAVRRDSCNCVAIYDILSVGNRAASMLNQCWEDRSKGLMVWVSK